MISPAVEYANRRNARQKTRAERERVHLRIGNLKLMVIAIGLAVAWLSLAKGAFSAYWLLIPGAVYLTLALWHELALRARARAQSATDFYERGLARIEDRWSGSGPTGERFRDASHVYADDLDLFGNGGLFQLLCSAQTPMGEARLAEWLLKASSVAEVRERQTIVKELRERLDLRENTALLGPDLVGTVDPDALVLWAEAKANLANRWLRALASLLAILEILAVILWATRGEYLLFFAVLAVNTVVYAWLHKRANAAITGIGCNENGLLIFSKILKQMEDGQFTSEKLRSFQRELRDNSGSSFRKTRRLAHIVNWIDARDSLLMKIIELPLLYTIQVGLAADSWRKRNGRNVRTFVEAVADFEALLSLSAYAYEHPEGCFPEFIEAKGHSNFTGEELGHPLIPAGRCVRNSVCLGNGARVLLVSGSNMSGKSTLLRTVGVNFVLAMTGVTVRAKSMKLSWMALGTRIRSTDSLQESRSNFYTEILRIRQVAALAEEDTPLLFLFDELLEGTNSHDRQIGSEGLLRALLSTGAIGMVTTHDLALTKMAESLDGNIHNVHFEDQIVDGEMIFDYKLRDGIVPKSNALDLMRWIGLKV